MTDHHTRSLSVRDLSIDYLTPRGPVHALRNVSLDVPAGSIVGVVGESGCGKSSLISTIIGQMPSNGRIASGSVTFGEDALHIFGPRRMRRIMGDRISVVFQDPMTSLNPLRPIGRQMMDIQYRSNRTRAEKYDAAVSMLARVGISAPEQRMKQHVYEMSGGMRQRISIAMALMANPDLLIADAPTTALDATLEVQIIELLRELQLEFGCSILFVSHHLGMIAELCDHVVVLYAGEVAESGPVRDIFHAPQHPYTRRLLECDPGLIHDTDARLPTIPGEIPDLSNVPGGCIFAPRCLEATAECHSHHPDPRLRAPGHRAWCHHAARMEFA